MDGSHMVLEVWKSPWILFMVFKAKKSPWISELDTEKLRIGTEDWNLSTVHNTIVVAFVILTRPINVEAER